VLRLNADQARGQDVAVDVDQVGEHVERRGARVDRTAGGGVPGAGEDGRRVEIEGQDGAGKSDS